MQADPLSRQDLAFPKAQAAVPGGVELQFALLSFVY
jgi:hypothetical protein